MMPSDELLKMIYGKNVDINQIKKEKNIKEIWNDIYLFLTKDDITKIEAVKNMNITDVLDVLKSKLQEIPTIKLGRNPVGYNNKPII